MNQTAATEKLCPLRPRHGATRHPTRVIMTNSCGPGRRESCVVVVRLAASSFDLLHGGRDITAPPYMAGKSSPMNLSWGPGGMNNSAQSACQLCIYSAGGAGDRRGGSYSASRWTWLPDLTLGSVHNARVERVWARQGGERGSTM